MLVSFVVPVYNVEKYLSTCLDSILSQGVESDNYEIILVEDCSTDGSLKICLDYCKRYNNIFLVQNEKNIGLGLTRNRGMEIAKGEYIHFVDSDDLLFPNSLRCLLSLNVVSLHPDIIRFRSSCKTEYVNNHNEIEYQGTSYNITPSLLSLSVWRYWFRRRFLIENNIDSLDKRTGQDAIFTFKALSKNPYIVVVSTVVYFYRLRGDSITAKKDIDYVKCLWEVMDEIIQIPAPYNLSNMYITEVYKDIISRFYRCRRTLRECVMFKNKMKSYGQYTIITKGPWYLQLSRVPLLLYLYLLRK